MTLTFLRDADWLHEARATAYVRAIFVTTVLGAILWVALSSGGIDRAGHPLGTDFKSFWAASELALEGHFAAVYQPTVHAAAERAIFAGRDDGYAAFFYPPPYLLVCLPFALLPYFAALLLWQAITGFAWLRVVQTLSGWRPVLPVLAFPAVLVNLGHGQNGFLTAALFGAGALALPRRKLLAGICFGCMIIKPQLMVLLPILLLLRRSWPTIAAGVITALGLAALSLAVFGLATWQAFLQITPLARETLQRGLVDPGKMQSAFAAVRVLHGSIMLAYAAQALVILIVCAAMAAAQRRQPDLLAMCMVTACATLLATPFVLDYDLTLLALPLAWLLAQGQRSGFLPWERFGIALGFVLPLISRPLAMHADLPIAPPILLAVFALLIRRTSTTPDASRFRIPGGSLLRLRSVPAVSCTASARHELPPESLSLSVAVRSPPFDGQERRP